MPGGGQIKFLSSCCSSHFLDGFIRACTLCSSSFDLLGGAGGGLATHDEEGTVRCLLDNHVAADLEFKVDLVGVAQELLVLLGGRSG